MGVGGEIRGGPGGGLVCLGSGFGVGGGGGGGGGVEIRLLCFCLVEARHGMSFRIYRTVTRYKYWILFFFF